MFSSNICWESEETDSLHDGEHLENSAAAVAILMSTNLSRGIDSTIFDL